jgi:hypothetical protein
MAFKFKVKKRPSMGQAVAASFASGVGQGIQAGGKAALQQMIRDRDAKQKFEKELNKELRVARSDISQLSNLVREDNPGLAKELNMLAVQSSTFGSAKGLNDAVIATGVFNDPTLSDIGKQFGAMIPKAPQQQERALLENEITSRGLDPAPSGYQWTISPTGNVSLEGRSPRVPLKPEITIPERQKKKALDFIIEKANMAGVSFDEFREANPDDNDVIMYNRISGSVPIRDDGMRLTDTATTGSTKSPNFSIPESEPAIVESTATSSNDGLRAVNPATGEKLILINGQWQTDQ